MIVKTTATEPRFNVGVARQNAYIDTEVTIVETANPEHIIAQYSIKKSPGRDVGGLDVDTGCALNKLIPKLENHWARK